MEQQKDVCLNCKAYINKKQQYLENSESVYEAAAKTADFVKGCRINCTHYKSINTNNKQNTTKQKIKLN
jgi:hypothetical protein